MADVLGFLEGLVYLKEGKCVYCRRDIPAGQVCPDCLEKQDRLLNKKGFFGNSLYVYLYDGIVRKLIHNFKYNDMPYLGVYMAKQMHAYLEFWHTPINGITYVPIHEERKKIRGFDQSEMLAAYVSAQSGIPWAKMLTRAKNTKPQFALSKAQRQKNIKGAFRLEGKPDCAGKRILLVDDIYTTGSTMNECARLLESAGAAVLPFAFARENLFD